MTDSARHIEMESIPSMVSMLFKAVTCRKPRQAEPQFLPLTVSARAIRVDAGKLEKFRAVCGFASTDTLPLTYPHIMAFALHMQLMLEPEFPFTPTGAVHVRNRIRQQRAIHVDEVLDFSVRLAGAERVDKGYEVSILTQVSVGSELIWDDLSVMLIRKGGSGGEQKQRQHAEPIPYRESEQWQLAANKGRQYAAASGDYNPIHLYPLTAKMMGFKRQIMHGMWSKSRSVAHLLPADYQGPLSVDVAFKLPIFLPCTVTLMFNRSDGNCQFEMKDGKGEKPHLAGQLLLGEGIPDTAN